MKVIARVFLATALIATISTAALSQDDETRQATGLPRQIGDNTRGPKMNVSGKITLEGLAKGSRIPIVSVIATYAGVITEKAYANDLGFFVIRDVPRENVILIVEVDGIEVARNPLVPSPMSNPRVDFNIPWTSGSGTMAKPGVISAGDLYSRSNNNQLLFEKAVAFEKAKDSAKAAELFNQMLAVDPKDFVAWTELGTVFFKSNSLDNAEACYFKAIELKKDYFLALLNLGKLYLGRKQGDNAVLVLSNAVKTKPESSDAHLFLGEAYLLNKKGSSAVHHFTEAIKLSPMEKAEAHLRLAALYDAAGAKNKASAEYKAFLEKQPGHPEKARLEKYIADNPIK